MLNPLNPRRTADRATSRRLRTKLALKIAAMAEAFLDEWYTQGNNDYETQWKKTASGSNHWEGHRVRVEDFSVL